jgi:hypothetical protein
MQEAKKRLLSLPMNLIGMEADTSANLSQYEKERGKK